MSESDEGGKVIDITSRLPPKVFGDNPSGKLAAELMKVVLNSNNHPHEQLAALMIVSHALQSIWQKLHGADEETMSNIRERALEIRENTNIEFSFKDDPDGKR